MAAGPHLLVSVLPAGISSPCYGRIYTTSLVGIDRHRRAKPLARVPQGKTTTAIILQWLCHEPPDRTILQQPTGHDRKPENVHWQRRGVHPALRAQDRLLCPMLRSFVADIKKDENHPEQHKYFHLDHLDFTCKHNLHGRTSNSWPTFRFYISSRHEGRFRTD